MGWHARSGHSPYLFFFEITTLPPSGPARNPHQRIQKQSTQSGAPLNGGYEFKELPA